MTGAVHSELTSEESLEDVLADYLQADGHGSLDRQRLIAAHPELSEHLREFFEEFDWMRQLADPPLPQSNPEATPLPNALMDTATCDQAADSLASDIRETQSPGTFDDYELLEEIARGGMGVVYRARQISLNRIVALKMILTGRLAAEFEVERFRSEAESAAQLDHPGIVPVHAVGEREGRHYYAMGFVEGLSLQDLISEEGVLPPRNAAELIRRVAEAIAYAHQRGVIHRDLKPANILLADSEDSDALLLTLGEQSRRCEPKVTDFGLAKRIEANSELTGAGQILGTPSYMPPEQAAGDTVSVGPLADVYSLGAVLYCMLTGRPPFRSANVIDTLQQVIRDDPVPPRRLNPAVPADLETICLKCLRKSPADRYDSARALADDLARFLALEPIRARPASRLQRMVKWIRRRPAAAGFVLASTAAALATVGLAVGAPLYMQLREEKSETQASKQQAERQRDRAERTEYLLRIFQADLYWRDGESGAARETLIDCPTEYRDWEWHYLHRLFQDAQGISSATQVPGSHDSRICSLGFSGDGETIVSVSEDGLVCCQEARHSEAPRILGPYGGPGFCAAVSKSGALVAVASSESTDGPDQHSMLRVLNTSTGDELSRMALPSQVNALAFAFDEARLAVASVDPQTQQAKVHVWWIGGLEKTLSLSSARPVRSLEFSPDGQFLAILLASPEDESDVVQLLDGTDGRLIREFDLATHSKTTRKGCVLAFSPDGVQLLVGEQSFISIWEVESGEFLMELPGHSEPISSLAFSPNASRLASAAADGSIRLWDWARYSQYRKNPVTTFVQRDRPWASINSQAVLTLRSDSPRGIGAGPVAFSPNGSLIATGSSDGRIQLFDGTPRFNIPRSTR